MSQLPWSLTDGQFRGALFDGPPPVETAAAQGAPEEQETEIIAARFTVSTSLPSGVEIELWPIGADSVTADSTFGRNLWITDDRTTGYAVFDITQISKAWEDGTLENHGVILHVVEENLEGQQPVAWNGSLNLWSNPALTLHRIELELGEGRNAANNGSRRPRHTVRVVQGEVPGRP